MARFSQNVVESGGKEFSFFGDGWSFDEEDLLLDAVEHFGFGSWFDVANFVKTRNERECENHYLRYYVQGNIGEATLASETAMSCGEEFAGNDEVRSGRFQELTVSQQQELGYMALRDDFERDYDNEAEVVLSGVSLHYTDTPADTALLIIYGRCHHFSSLQDLSSRSTQGEAERSRASKGHRQELWHHARRHFPGLQILLRRQEEKVKGTEVVPRSVLAVREVRGPEFVLQTLQQPQQTNEVDESYEDPDEIEQARTQETYR